MFDDNAGETNDAHPMIHTHKFKEGSSALKPVFWVLQLLSMGAIYAGVGGVIFGIVTYPQQSTKISAAVQCTVLLSILYFIVYLTVFLGRLSPDSSSSEVEADRLPVG